MLPERNLPLVAHHKSPSFDCSNPQREKSRPAASACAESVTFFALHAENGAKWAIFAVYGEFCTGLSMPACVLGEFCTGLSMPTCVPGEFCTGWGGPACVLGEFCPGWRPKGATGEVLRGQGRRPHRSQVLPYQARWQRPARPTWPRPRPLPLAGEGEVHEEQVKRDDDGRNEETGDTQGTIVRVAAHDLGRGGEAHERDDREGDAE